MTTMMRHPISLSKLSPLVLSLSAVLPLCAHATLPTVELPANAAPMADTAPAVTPQLNNQLTEQAVSTPVADEGNWVDQQHDDTKRWLNRTAHHIDDWFGKTDAADPAKASLRVMADATWNEYDGTTIKPRVRGRIKLPTLENRLSIMIGDEELDVERQGGGIHTDNRIVQPYENAQVVDGRQARKDNSSLALRWSKFRDATGLDVDLGLRSSDAFIRTRFRRNWQMSHDASGYFEQMYRYGSKSEHTLLTTLEFTQPLTPHRSLISRSHLLYTHQDTEDLEWSSSFYQKHDWQVSQGRGELSYGLYAGGNVEDKKANLNIYGPYISYRQPVWRPWLFIQNDVSYYNDKQKDRDHHPALFSRVEVVF